MAEGPLIDIPLRQYTSRSLKEIYFITIKDNAQSMLWTKLGKINDWCRKFYDHYVIVKGTTGGIHFHILATAKRPKKIRIPKGIHLHIKTLEDKAQGLILHDHIESAQNAEKAQYYAIESLIKTIPTQHLKLALFCRTHIMKVSARRKARQARSRKKDKCAWAVSQVIKYLNKNLMEPRDDEIHKYDDYVIF